MCKLPVKFLNELKLNCLPVLTEFQTSHVCYLFWDKVFYYYYLTESEKSEIVFCARSLFWYKLNIGNGKVQLIGWVMLVNIQLLTFFLFTQYLLCKFFCSNLTVNILCLLTHFISSILCCSQIIGTKYLSCHLNIVICMSQIKAHLTC